MPARAITVSNGKKSTLTIDGGRFISGKGRKTVASEGALNVYKTAISGGISTSLGARIYVKSLKPAFILLRNGPAFQPRRWLPHPAWESFSTGCASLSSCRTRVSPSAAPAS